MKSKDSMWSVGMVFPCFIRWIGAAFQRMVPYPQKQSDMAGWLSIEHTIHLHSGYIRRFRNVHIYQNAKTDIFHIFSAHKNPSCEKTINSWRLLKEHPNVYKKNGPPPKKKPALLCVKIKSNSSSENAEIRISFTRKSSFVYLFKTENHGHSPRIYTREMFIMKTKPTFLGGRATRWFLLEKTGTAATFPRGFGVTKISRYFSRSPPRSWDPRFSSWDGAKIL